MSITPKEFLSAIRGNITPELRERIKAEFEDPNSKVFGWMEGVERWANKVLKHTPPQGGRVRPSGFAQAKRDLDASFVDVIAVLKGTAPNEIVQRVRKDAADPDSPISRWLQSHQADNLFLKDE